MTYRVAVRRDFIARHFLIGGDWGPENELHAHHYQVELQLAGPRLNRHGYLVDIVEIEAALEAVCARYADQVLNDQPEFSGLNPSIEHFARIIAEELGERIPDPNIGALTVRIWENDIAWASFRLER